MLEVERGGARAPEGVDPRRVARAFQQWVLPAGKTALDQLEKRVEHRFQETASLAEAPSAHAPGAWGRWISQVLPARPHQARLLQETPWEEVRGILRDAMAGRYSSRDLPALAERIRGAPPGVTLDTVANLLHCAAPDRIPLLSRWVWNPGPGSGALGEFVHAAPRSYEEAQARIGEVRLHLTALGFPSRTFAAVDVLFALTYAGRLSHAARETFQGGGIETLLPGNLGLAAILLGVRGRRADADR
jgi:hypothetical protein